MTKDNILALKYRPKKLTDCIGQDVAVRILTNSFKNNNLYPCYLFNGNTGNGKTTASRILAAMENCEEGAGLEPCGKCSTCKAIFNGTHYDVKEINASQNRGIDDIRNIQEFIGIAPLSARVKYVMLDECLDYHSRISTEKGMINIGKIVNEKMDVKVKSFNEKTKLIEYKKITGWFKNSGKEINRLKFETRGVLLASDNHLINTPFGYKKVSELNVGDSVYRNGYNLTESQKQMILGCMLGDACIVRNDSLSKGFWKGSSTSARLKFIHSCKQESYLRYKHKSLGILSSNIKLFNHRYDENSPFTKMAMFQTKTDPSLIKISSLFEFSKKINGKRKKTIKEEVLHLLDWQGVAFWFADDGSSKGYVTEDNRKRATSQIHTSGFSYKEQILFKQWFLNRGIDVKINKSKKGHYYLYLNPESSYKLFEKISKYIHPSMRYKVPGFEDIPFVDVSVEDNESICEQKLTLKEKIGYKGITYDLEIEDNHNYFASGTLVHNCHMLTPEAQEAALKMCEEPPSYARFVLATTDPQDLQETLQNRCMSINFLKTTWPQLAEYLKSISQLEKINIDESSLKIVAKMSNGSIRNSLRNLQTLWSAYPNEAITKKKTQVVLGTIDDNLWFDFVENMLKIDVPSCFKIIQDILTSGQDFKLILDGFQEHLRNLLVILSCKDTSGLIYLGPEEKQKYIEQIKKLSIDVVIDWISQLGLVAQNVEYNLNPQLLLEQYTIQCMITIGKNQKKSTESQKK